MIAKVISFINLKGGVAKTTTAVGTALALAERYGKKVLVIDLDPQTNCTNMLIGEERWRELDDAGHTIFTLYEDMLDDGDNFVLENVIQKNVGNIKGVTGVDLLPSSLKMVYLQDELIEIKNKRDFSLNPYDVLGNAIDSIMGKYDYILIDCPPNLGILTLNGLKISDGYVIPTVPDILSTYGIPQILNRIDKFSKNTKHKIKCLGIVPTKVKLASNLHKNTMEDLRLQENAPLFETVFPDNIKLAEAAEYLDEPVTFRQKWGYQGQADNFFDFAAELMERMG